MKGFIWVLAVCGSSLLEVLSQDVYDATSVPEDFTMAFEDTQPEISVRTSKSVVPVTPPLTTQKPTTVSVVTSTTPEARNVTIKENEVMRNQTRPKKEVTTLMTDLTDEYRDLPENRYRFDDAVKPVQYYNFPPSEVPKPLTTRNPPAKSPSEQLFLDSQKYDQLRNQQTSDQPIRNSQNFDQPIKTQPFPVRQSTPGKAVGSRSTTEKAIPSYALADQNRLPIAALGEHQHHRAPGGASEEAQAIVNQEVYAWGKPGSRWEKERNGVRKNNMTRVNHLEAQCQDDFMKIRVNFNGSFTGMIYSAGYAYDPSCVYINGTGRDWYEFYIQLNRCGTLGGNNHNLDSRKQPTKNFMWNTVTVQYNSLIEEEWDEHFKVTCEYGYDFWKTISFPFLDVEVATGNPVVFTLAPPECHMEIRQGYGTTGPRVSGPVRVGDPLTLMVYMRSQYDGFDIIVSDCYAHNGGSRRIQLIDNNGCPVDDKIISRFRGTWSDSGLYETQVFAYMKTFRFTGSPALYIECDVRMCHGQCPNQACHWRGAKEIVKRSIDDVSENKTLAASERLNLYQALQVVGDGEVAEQQKADEEEANQICLAPGKLGLAIGAMFIILLLFGVVSVISCVRARRLQALLKRSNQEDFYQAYTHSDFSSFAKSQHS